VNARSVVAGTVELGFVLERHSALFEAYAWMALRSVADLIALVYRGPSEADAERAIVEMPRAV